MVRLIKEQSCGHIWCALKVIMMIDTPIGSPNWAANYFIKRQAKRSPCLLPTKNMQPGTGRVLPFLCLSWCPQLASQQLYQNSIRDQHVITHQKSANLLKAEDVSGDVDKKVWDLARCVKQGVKEFGNGFKWFWQTCSPKDRCKVSHLASNSLMQRCML